MNRKPHTAVEGLKATESDENFLHRWSQRKHAARKPASAVAAETAATPTAPEKVLTDADMPPLESLDADSDYSVFMSPGVSDELRQKALRKLFRQAQFNQRDPLDGEYYDCHGYEPLGDVITYDMREEMEREAQKLKEAEAQVAESAKPAAPAPEPQTVATASIEAKPAAKVEPAVHRHSRHLRKRTGAKKRNVSR